jgi:uncharacterized protein Yka (UPF0111/DUF47 family)
MFARELKIPQIATFENAHAFLDETETEIAQTFAFMAQLRTERSDISGLSSALDDICKDLDATSEVVQQARTRLIQEEFDDDHFIIVGGEPLRGYHLLDNSILAFLGRCTKFQNELLRTKNSPKIR